MKHNGEKIVKNSKEWDEHSEAMEAAQREINAIRKNIKKDLKKLKP